MDIKKIIHKNLKENHDIIRKDESLDLLIKATDSLVDCVRYLESLTQITDNQHCNEAIIKILDFLRHPMGNLSSEGGFDEKKQTNLLSMLEMISSVIGREKESKKMR
jgi:hypothetical protein